MLLPLMRSLPALVLLVVAASGCGEPEKKRRRVDDEEPANRPALPAAASATASGDSSSSRRIEDVLVEHSRSYPEEIRIKHTAARSVQCGTIPVGPATTLGDVLMTLASRGLRITMNERHISISGRISAIGACDEERRFGRYTIEKGEIREAAKDPDPDVVTPPDPGAAPFRRPVLSPSEPPVQTGPSEWEVSEGTADKARSSGWSWFFGAGRSPGPRVVPAIPPGSLAEKLGLKEGDRILALNGYSLIDEDQLLEAYPNSARAKTFLLTVERAGKKLDLKYTIK